MTERALYPVLMLAASRCGARLFRNNTGQGWVGQVIQKTPARVILENPRPLHAGLCNGSSDLIGWQPVTVTADMVGQTVAVFTAVEVKSGRAMASMEQQAFIDAVRQAGGRAGVVRDENELAAVLNHNPSIST